MTQEAQRTPDQSPAEIAPPEEDNPPPPPSDGSEMTMLDWFKGAGVAFTVFVILMEIVRQAVFDFPDSISYSVTDVLVAVVSNAPTYVVSFVSFFLFVLTPVITTVAVGCWWVLYIAFACAVGFLFAMLGILASVWLDKIMIKLGYRSVHPTDHSAQEPPEQSTTIASVTDGFAAFELPTKLLICIASVFFKLLKFLFGWFSQKVSIGRFAWNCAIGLSLICLPLSSAYAWQKLRLQNSSGGQIDREDVARAARLQFDFVACASGLSIDDAQAKGFRWTDPETWTSCIISNHFFEWAFERNELPRVALTIQGGQDVVASQLVPVAMPPAPDLPFRTVEYFYLGDFGDWALLAPCADPQSNQEQVRDESCTLSKQRILVRQSEIVELELLPDGHDDIAPDYPVESDTPDLLTRLTALASELPDVSLEFTPVTQSVETSGYPTVIWAPGNESVFGLPPEFLSQFLIANDEEWRALLAGYSEDIETRHDLIVARLEDLAETIGTGGGSAPQPAIVMMPQTQVSVSLDGETIATNPAFVYNSVIVNEGVWQDIPRNTIILPFFTSNATSIDLEGRPARDKLEVAFLSGASSGEFTDPTINADDLTFLGQFAGNLGRCLAGPEGTGPVATLDVIGLASREWTAAPEMADYLNTYLAEGRRFLILQLLAQHLAKEDEPADIVNRLLVRIWDEDGATTTSGQTQEVSPRTVPLSEILGLMGEDVVVDDGRTSALDFEILEAFGRYGPYPEDPRIATIAEVGWQGPDRMEEHRGRFVNYPDVGDDQTNVIAAFFSRAVVVEVVSIDSGPCAFQ